MTAPLHPHTELERVRDAEVVQEGDAYWQSQVSEWTVGHAQALIGHLRSARAAASVERRYGEASLAEFAKEVGAGRSTCYQYAYAWNTLLFEFGSEESLSSRLENSPLSVWQVIECMKAPEGERKPMLDRAEDENLSISQIRAHRQGEEEKNVEVIEVIECPHCEQAFALSEAHVRKVEG